LGDGFKNPEIVPASVALAIIILGIAQFQISHYRTTFLGVSVPGRQRRRMRANLSLRTGVPMKTVYSYRVDAAPSGAMRAVPHPDGGEVWVRPARLEEIEDIHSLIASEISQDVGPVESMRAVFLRNPVAFWRI